VQSPNNMVAKCQSCGEKKEGNYIKYNFNGFELMFLVCIDCFMHAQMAGLREFRDLIAQFRATTREEAEKMAVEMAKPPVTEPPVTKKKVSKRVPMKPLGQNRGAVRVPMEKK